MKTLTIEIPEKAEKVVIDFIELLGGRVISIDSNVIPPKKGQIHKDDETSKDSNATEFPDLSTIIFMKFGYHANEKDKDIIIRKKLEYEKTGRMFWGYGGSSCHPQKQVQAFVKKMHLEGKKVYLAISFTDSKFENEGKSSLNYSIDGSEWNKVPDGIDVRGSKYAIVCSELKDCKISLDLNNYEVAIGPSAGNKATDYLKGQSDKGCLVKSNDNQSTLSEIKSISYLAEIVEPYAVFMD